MPDLRAEQSPLTTPVSRGSVSVLIVSLGASMDITRFLKRLLKRVRALADVRQNFFFDSPYQIGCWQQIPPNKHFGMGDRRAMASWHLGPRGLEWAFGFASFLSRGQLPLRAQGFSLKTWWAAPTSQCCCKEDIWGLCFVNSKVLKKWEGEFGVLFPRQHFLHSIKQNTWGMPWGSSSVSPLVAQPVEWKLRTECSAECRVHGLLARKGELSQNLSRGLSPSTGFIYTLERGLQDFVTLGLQRLRYFILSPAETISKFQSPHVSLLLGIFQEFWLINASVGLW